MELVSQEDRKVSLVCRLFGRCRQAFYQSKADIEHEVGRERQLLQSSRDIRQEDPGIGAYKLWLMMIDMYGRGHVIGRDRFYTLLRRHGLMLPPPKPRHTTNSNHRYHKWKNLIRGKVLTAANQLWVADITYIPTARGVCYLHLVTDAYSHKVIGWVLADTLKASASMEALRQAMSQAMAMKGSDSLKGLVHHSDRGVQYCCDDYVSMLKSKDISISMTEDYKPTDNAIAERVNGIIKEECVYRERQFNTPEHARAVIGRFIDFYNNRRPHMSLSYNTPAVAHMETGEQKRRWKNRSYPAKDGVIGEKVVSLPSQTASPGESICR